MKWTKEKDDELRQYYNGGSTATACEIAERLGTTRLAVAVRANRLGLKHKKHPSYIELPPEQTQWLRRNYPHVSTDICAMFLKISNSTCTRKAHELGLSKTPQFMKEAQAHAAKKAKESHIKNGTYPPKGFIIPGSEKYRFKPGRTTQPQPKQQ